MCKTSSEVDGIKWRHIFSLGVPQFIILYFLIKVRNFSVFNNLTFCALFWGHNFLDRPHNDPNIDGGDPYRTIFVGRLDYQTNEDKLGRIFEVFGHVESVRVVRDTKTGKSRGYGFVEFRDERAAQEALWRGDRRIDGQLCIVDRELGRTKIDWKPKRLGGGKGDARKDRQDEEFISQI